MIHLLDEIIIFENNSVNCLKIFEIYYQSINIDRVRIIVISSFIDALIPISNPNLTGRDNSC